MNALLTEGLEDKDSWVQVVAQLMATLPEAGTLNLQSDDARVNIVSSLAQKFAAQADARGSDTVQHLSNAKYLGQHFFPTLPDTEHSHFSLRAELAGDAEEAPKVIPRAQK